MFGKVIVESGLKAKDEEVDVDEDEDEPRMPPTNIPPSEIGDSMIDISVKFFNSAAYLKEDGSYPKLHDEIEKGTFTCDHDTQHLIRVLYSKVKGNMTEPSKQADSTPPNDNDIDILTFGVSSEAIALFFQKQLGISAEDDHLIRFGKPFRPLIRNLGPVREQLKRLKSLHGLVMIGGVEKTRTAFDSSTEAPVTTLNREESDLLPFATTKSSGDDEIPAYDRSTALLHFQAFLSFIDEFFGKKIQLYERLRNGEEHHIAFENLWMLFDTDDTIYCPLREATSEEHANSEGDDDHTQIRRYTPQAYRVVATSGGMPLTRTMAPVLKVTIEDDVVAPGPVSKSSMKANVKTLADILTQTAKISRNIRGNYSDFKVYCFYIDFDGVEFGMVQDLFIFNPYEREMNIHDLEAYPVNYKLCEKLFHNGEKFIDATRVSHLQYEGLTVGPSREEINMKLAFEGGSSTDKSFIEVPEFKSLSSLWLYNSRMETYELLGKSDYSCSNKWCYNQDCTSNVYVESQKTQRNKIQSKIELVLEEYESEKKQQHKDDVGWLKKLMADNDIITLLPGAVPGFALRNRKWVLLNLAQLRPLEQSDSWENLVLPRGHRKMVQAMVETHTQNISANKDVNVGMDLVQGKGRGCVILLHGVPGVGKTSTAECVAAYTKKLLYSITCGDIGVEPRELERNMDNHFKLANRWGCVLLLDEAGVFLAKRDQKDIQRNGPVSAFLRMLEYYSGILFLTTNRVGAIDDAFRSRLHLTLYYPKLTKKQTKQIFEHTFQRIAGINVDRRNRNLPAFDYVNSEKKIMRWAEDTWKELRWNGRQIRNAFQTVLALSEFHAKSSNSESTSPIITKKDFKIVASASIQLNQYPLATHGQDEDSMAGRETMRAKNYAPSPEMAKLFYSGFSSEGEDSSDESKASTDSDESDDSEARRKKKSSKRKKEKKSKSSNKKSKKISEKDEKSEKKSKEKKKERKKKKEETEESEESEDSD
ncbi:hypothetical protein sscle_16g108850 [Sclerotinia sclerotiorum 1980 UF-70]|uniref:AAA+ ATPase domain-containing protein n=1 Tax=Sclerotinia sclerotiorum (strain ATCC 18683 / 1980 / Ss-1) TaxID=665079 RepID=A0A1D9QME8_SCLS1|nr:hypothetical protein sscle_16g108850 [Sclerotinia sclerotiorum 1980 UF-70]